MIQHSSLGDTALERNAQVQSLIRRGEIVLAGNRRLKIYGTLRCSSGKRMMVEQRVFFASEQEALNYGYRPCGHCLREKYRQWKETSTTGSGSASAAGTTSAGNATGDSDKTVAAQKPKP